MDTSSVKCLINSISRFILLVSCQTMKAMPVQKDYRDLVNALKLLKAVLDEVVDYKIPSDEILCKECEELDTAINETREFMENWSPKMSKLCSVLWSEPLLMKIRSSSIEICHILCRLLQSSSSTISLSNVQDCMQELQCMKQERVTEYIEEAIISQRDNIVPCTKHLLKIIEFLNLTPNQELLKESISVEKERINAQVNKAKGELDQIYQIVNLVSHIRNCMVKIQRFEARSGVSIPSYFRCPLSSELMLDPVIVASGQTYERSSIQKWLDHGLTICPKTRQTLTHTNLIPNYTVKAMISNWCEENNIKPYNNSELTEFVSVPSLSDHVSPQDLIHTDSSPFSLHNSNSMSRSSHEVGNGFEKQKSDASSRLNGKNSNGFQSRETEKFYHPSPEQSYIHSRSESASSAISSVDYMPPVFNEVPRISSKRENVNELSGEITTECLDTSPQCKEPGLPSWLPGKKFDNLKIEVEVAGNVNRNYLRANSLPFSDSGSDEVTSASHVKKLIEDLKSQSNEVQTTAAEELRLLAKHNMENRVIIGQCGVIAPLVSLLYSEMKRTQEHAVTALLNLSINENNKAMIAKAGAIEPLIHVLKTGNDGAKENSAATLFSLSVLEEYKVKIGRSGAVKALVDLLHSGTLRGKKDAATALFNLSIFHENKARIVQAGAVKYLVELMDPATGMVDKAVALLANLSTIGEGRLAIGREEGIPLLVEIVESGSQRGKENAASVLLQLCLHSSKYCTLVLQEGAVPPLVALSQSGTPRAKEKAQQLLSHFRNQREGATGKGKS
nr:U-box domain-containing protein 3 [Quercus suber]XP_023907557.1 U-box domain-containing protein 3 [Quercus suber]